MNKATLHFYRRERAHQHDVFVTGGGSLTVYPSGRTELTFGSAAYGFHAVAAFLASKRTQHFRQDMAATVRAFNSRSAAAKRGHKGRKARAA